MQGRLAAAKRTRDLVLLGAWQAENFARSGKNFPRTFAQVITPRRQRTALETFETVRRLNQAAQKQRS